MSDVIRDAKQLLEGSTPGPWTAEIESFTENEGGDFSLQAAILAEGEPLMGADDGMVYHKEGNFGLAAAAPELAQALAEETWEYSIQIKDHTGEWETATNSETHLEEWWESKKHAEWAMAEEQEYGEHCRLVRRRVSQPEVINE